MDLYLIKIGGSVITDTKRINVAKRDEIERLLTEINNARKKSKASIILGNGAGSFGHISAKKYRIHEGLLSKDSIKGSIETQQAVRALNSLIVDIALDMGMPLFPFSPSSFVNKKGRIIVDGFISQIKLALKEGFIPSIYGDVVMDAKQGVAIASTEDVLNFIAPSLKPKKIVLGTDVDGVFDKDPFTNRGAVLIERIDSKNIRKIVAGTGGAKKIDVTGGMRTKVATLHKMVVKTGATGYVVNLTKKGRLYKLLSGKEVRCTIVRK